MGKNFAITATTKEGTPKGVPFARIKETVLGKAYTVSLAFVGAARARTLNQTYRRKNTVPNVLAFPLSDTEGEIIICLQQARKDARAFSMRYTVFVGYLFIHGLLHLKGYTHGSRMDAAERTLAKRFALT